ncbi:MAG: hypothetical protein M3296_03030, partial [Actinomycetota bacterium]|nr:hypothetical protein [Actinomycetota bacterium]
MRARVPTEYGRGGVRIGGRWRLSITAVACMGACAAGVAGVTAMSRGATAGAATPGAAAECVAGTSVTSVFASTGREQCYRVPSDVTSVHVVATGGRPSSGGDGDPQGGFGARVAADVPVSPGQTLYVEVDIDREQFSAGNPYNPRTDGGGASDVRTCSMPCELTGRPDTDPRLVVAGGGGAGGAPSLDYYG